MSKPSAGTYYIVNRVVSLSAEPLALNFDGINAVVTVTEFDKSSNQAWIVNDYIDGRTQSVSPQNAPNLQIGMGPGVLKTLPAGGYVWTIRENNGVATVQDGGVTVYWGLNTATDGESVSFGAGNGSDKQTWVLVPA